MLFNVICNNFQYSYQSQSMIFDIPLIYNIFSKARNHIDHSSLQFSIDIKNFLFEMKAIFHYMRYSSALLFILLFFLSLKRGKNWKKKFHWLQPKTFRSFTIDNGIRFQNWYSLYRVTITYNVHVHSSLLSVSTRCASFSLIEQTRYVIFREME